MTVAGQQAIADAAAAKASAEAAALANGSTSYSYYDRGVLKQVNVPSTREKILSAAVQTGQGFGSLGGTTVESRTAYARSLGFSPTEVRTARGELPFGSRRAEKQEITKQVLKLEREKRSPVGEQQKRYASLIQSLNERERGQAQPGRLTRSPVQQPPIGIIQVGQAQTTKIVNVGQPTGVQTQELQSIKTPIQKPFGFGIKQFGGEISPTLPTAGLQKKLFGKTTNLGSSVDPISAYFEFEQKVISPKLEKLFVTQPEEFETEKNRIPTPDLKGGLFLGERGGINNFFKPGGLFFGTTGNIGKTLGIKPTSPKTQEFLTGTAQGVGKFVSKPSNIAIFGLGGAGFKLAEEGVLFGVTKVPKLLEFATSPVGQIAGKTVRAGLLLGAGGLTALDIARQPTVAQKGERFGTALGEFSSFGAGARGGGALLESPGVRESGFGSPSRRLEEVRGIKSITEESLTEAFKTSKIEVSSETRKITAVELQKELRTASDVVQRLKGNFRLPVREITPEFLQKNIKGGISKTKAIETVKTLQKFAPELFLKGSITQRNREIGDIDLAINPRFKSVFEGLSSKTGVGFDVKTLKEGRQTATAQIEPLQPVSFRVGGKVAVSRETGVVEQLSRKVEGSIRFATGQEGGATRAKDIADVFGLRKSIEEARRPKLFNFGKLSEGERIKISNSKVSRPSVLSSRFFEPSRVVTRSESSFSRNSNSIEKSIRSSLKSSKPSAIFSKSFSPSPSPSPSPSVSPSVSRSIKPSPSPSPSPYQSPSVSSSSILSKRFSKSFSTSPSLSPDIVRPPRFTGFKLPELAKERSFNRESLGGVKTKFRPSLFGIALGKRLKAEPIGKTFGGFEVRGVPKLGGLGGIFETLGGKGKKVKKGKGFRL